MQTASRNGSVLSAMSLFEFVLNAQSNQNWELIKMFICFCVGVFIATAVCIWKFSIVVEYLAFILHVNKQLRHFERNSLPTATRDSVRCTFLWAIIKITHHTLQAPLECNQNPQCKLSDHQFFSKQYDSQEDDLYSAIFQFNENQVDSWHFRSFYNYIVSTIYWNWAVFFFYWEINE